MSDVKLAFSETTISDCPICGAPNCNYEECKANYIAEKGGKITIKMPSFENIFAVAEKIVFNQFSDDPMTDVTEKARLIQELIVSHEAVRV